MKILFVCQSFAPAWFYGGPPRVIYDLSRKLVEHKHKIVVYTTDALNEKKRIQKRKTVIDGVEVFYFPNLSNSLAWRQHLFLPQGFRAAIRSSLSNFDFVHLFEFRSYQNVITSMAARGKIPYGISAFGSLPNTPKRIIKKVFDDYFGKAILKNASYLFAQNENEALLYRTFGINPLKIKIIPLGIDFKEFKKLPPRGQLRKIWKVNDDEILLLFLGRIHRLKGLDLLLKTFARLVSQRGDLKLAIVGRDDGYLLDLKRLISSLSLEKKVIVATDIAGKKRLLAYRDADIFVLTPSHFEETSLAALEACASGTPVVITRQAEIPSLSQSKAGFIINDNRVQLKNALEKLIANPDLRKKMGINGRLMIKKRFDFNKIAEILEETYQKALG